jgi:hypothetical protein
VSEPRDFAARSDLEAAIHDLAGAVAFPAPSSDFAATVTSRLTAQRPRPWWRGGFIGTRRPDGAVFRRRPVWRSALLAVALILLVAAVAGALGLGVPGIRLILGPPPTPTVTPAPSTSSRTPTSSPATPAPSGPGSRLALGDPVPLAGLGTRAGFAVRLPQTALLGAPDAAYVDATKANQVSLVWRPSAGLPATTEPAIGLLLLEMDGRFDTGFISKAIGSGTTAEPVVVAGNPGFWISGNPHFFFYQRRDGQTVEDSRRWVGDTLIWSDGTMTYRLETAVGRSTAIAIAESLQ